MLLIILLNILLGVAIGAYKYVMLVYNSFRVYRNDTDASYNTALTIFEHLISSPEGIFRYLLQYAVYVGVIGSFLSMLVIALF